MDLTYITYAEAHTPYTHIDYKPLDNIGDSDTPNRIYYFGALYPWSLDQKPVLKCHV